MFNIEIGFGCTRRVYLIGKYAFKVPQFKYKWEHFLRGLLANIQEEEWSRNLFKEDDRICPVLFSVKGGWLVIMPRLKQLTDEEFEYFNYEEFQAQKDYKVPVENKSESFGWFNNKIVALDYGS